MAALAGRYDELMREYIDICERRAHAYGDEYVQLTEMMNNLKALLPEAREWAIEEALRIPRS